MLQTLASDVLLALRSMRRAPLFTLAAVLSLALGLGANTAIFSLFDQLLLRAVAVRDPAELVMLDSPGPKMGRMEGPNTFPYPTYKAIRDNNQVFSGLLGRSPIEVTVAQPDGQGVVIDAEMVTGNYFDVLGVTAETGRLLTPADDVTPGGHPVVVMSEEYWRTRHGADPAIAGKSIRLNGHPFEVVGVARRGFRGIQQSHRASLFAPLMMKAQLTPTFDGISEPRYYFLHLFGRLKPGLTRQQAQTQLQPFFHTLLEADLSTMPGRRSESFSKRFLARQLVLEDGSGGMPNLRKTTSTPMAILMGMVTLVLLIACANVANLLVARAASRQKEIAVRLAMGARRAQLIRQLLVESMVLAAMGAAAGLLTASWTLEVLKREFGDTATGLALQWQLDSRALLFLTGISVLAGVVFGLLPALQATRPALTPALKESGSVSATRSAIRSKRVLVVAQVSLSLLLLIGSGLFLRTLANLEGIDPGFRKDHLITFATDAPLSGYPLKQAASVYGGLMTRLAAVPGVQSVSVAENALLADVQWMSTVRVEGYNNKDGEDMNPVFNGVSEDFFRHMGIPLGLGREFTATDAAGAPRVAIVNEAFAKYFFGTGSPVGHRFRMGGDGAAMEIVGMVRDGKMTTLREDVKRRVYLPMRQSDELGGVAFYVRTRMDPAQMIPALRRETAAAYPGLAFHDPKTMENQIDSQLTQERLVAGLCSAFGLLATLLAAVGLYGVMAWSVARRTRELGIRSALGADRREILGLVLRETGYLALAGVGLGLPVALGLTRLVKSQLYGLGGNDPVTLATAAVSLMLVAMLAGLVPARRAARVDPLVALRYE